MDENEILDDENSESQKNYCDQTEREKNNDDDNFVSQKVDSDNRFVGENQIKIDRQCVDSEEDQKINLERRNSFESLSKDFSLIFPVKQEIIWNSCVSKFDFEQFENKLALAKISTEKLPSKLAKFKLNIINSILGQDGYFINKRNLENVPVDDNFLNSIINSCIDFPSRENFVNDQGNKITTLIKELSQWMEEQKLTIDNASDLLHNYYKKIYDNIISGELKLDKPLLSLENLKEIMECINFKQNENIDWDIYTFLRIICDLLYGQNENDIQKYITTMLNLLGYKIKGVENSDEAIFDLNAQVYASEFYKNAQNVETGLKFLKVIKVLGFELSLDDNNKDVFVLKQIDEVDRLIADIEYFHSDEINNWVENVNASKEEDRNGIAADHYLTIDNSDSFVKMKQDSILSFIKNSENADKLQEKYKILLDEKNQDRLDTVILKKETLDWMIQNVITGSFEENEFDEVMNTVKKFYKYTDKSNDSFSEYVWTDNPFVFFALIFAFKSLTTDMVVKILSHCAKNIVIGNQDFSLYRFARSLKVLKTKEQIPQAFIELLKCVIDFENVNLYNDNELGYFYDILYSLVEHSEKYDENNPINAIKDVFGGENKNYNDILNELSKIPNAQDFLNLSVMLKHNSQLASVLENNNLKISLANVAEENNIHDEQNANENNLKFKLEKMNDMDNLLIKLSNCDGMNLWVQNFAAYWRKQDENESESENEGNKDENKENESKDIKSDYLEIKTFDDLKNMKKTCISSFIQKREDLKTAYGALLESENIGRLDEVILDTKTVYYTLLSLPKKLLSTNDFNEFIEVVKKFLRYTDEPNKKLIPQISLCLLGSFKKRSLSDEQIKIIFELAEFEQDDDILGIRFGLSNIAYAFTAAQFITPELFDLAIKSIAWGNIDLCEYGEIYNFCSIIICLIENSEAYDEDNLTAALDYVFVDKDATCRKFVDEYLAKIPGYYQVLKNLKYMKALGMDVKKLADMFEKANYSLPCNYQCDYMDAIETLREEKNHDYVCEQLDEISIYGKEIINDDNEQNKIKIVKNTNYQIIKDELNVGGSNQIQLKKGYEVQQNETIMINKQEVQIKFQQIQKENNIGIKPVPTQSNEGRKQTSSRKVTGVEILAFIIAIACIIAGSIVSHYIYLGLVVSCILLFFDSRSRKQKSTYENLKSGNTAVPRTDKLITNQRYDDQIQMNSYPALINNQNETEIKQSGNL